MQLQHWEQWVIGGEAGFGGVVTLVGGSRTAFSSMDWPQKSQVFPDCQEVQPLPSLLGLVFQWFQLLTVLSPRNQELQTWYTLSPIHHYWWELKPGLRIGGQQCWEQSGKSFALIHTQKRWDLPSGAGVHSKVHAWFHSSHCCLICSATILVAVITPWCPGVCALMHTQYLPLCVLVSH